MLFGLLICAVIIIWIVRASAKANAKPSYAVRQAPPHEETETSLIRIENRKPTLRRKAIRRRQHDPACRYYETELRGVSHENEDGSDRQAAIENLRNGEELDLIPDPHNVFDKDAVRVLNKEGIQVGFLPAHTQVSGQMARGWKFRAFIVRKSGGYYGARITMEIEAGPPPEQ